MLNLVKGFLCIYWDNPVFVIFQFVKVVYHIDWFANIEEFLHPWVKPIWSWYMIFLICCWILFFRILLSIFFNLCSSVILACSFLFLWHICLISILGWWWPQRMNLGVYLPLQCSGRVWVGLVIANCVNFW